MDSQETNVYFTLLTAGLIFGVIVIFFLITIIRYQKQGVQAYLKRMEADLTLLENERAQLALDLHDELGSQLAAVQLMTNELQVNPLDSAILTERLTLLIRNMRLSIRQLSNSMVSYSLQREGLQIALEELLSNLFYKSSVKVQFEWKLYSGTLRQEAEIHIYRIAQELLTNIIKHACATTAKVALHQTDDTILLYVSDNGKSFDQTAVRTSQSGLGLRNVTARVRVLRGHIRLSTGTKGTGYEIELPVEQVIR